MSNFLFNKGDKVKILNASLGWGDGGVVKGMVGVVLNTTKANPDVPDDHDRVYIDVPGHHSGWVCKPDDLEHSDERVLQRTQATQWQNRMSERFTKELRIARDNSEASARKITTLESKVNDVMPTDADVFEKIKSQVIDLRFDGTWMLFSTNRITVKYGLDRASETISVDVGWFKVEVNFESGMVYAKQQDNGKFVGHYDHPHVSSGEVCWGTYYSPMTACIKRLDVCGMLRLMLDFLGSCDRDGWYRNVFFWLSPEERAKYGLEDICDRCNNPYDECDCHRCGNCDAVGEDACECVYCEHCDSYNDNCECLKCPDSYQVLEDNMFPDHGCISCPMLCKNEHDGEWQCWYDRDCPEHSTLINDWNFTPADEKIARYITLTQEGAEHIHSNEIKARELAGKRMSATTPTGERYQINYGDVTDSSS